MILDDNMEESVRMSLLTFDWYGASAAALTLTSGQVPVGIPEEFLRAKRTAENVAAVKSRILSALDWMITAGYASDIRCEVDTARLGITGFTIFIDNTKITV